MCLGHQPNGLFNSYHCRSGLLAFRDGADSSSSNSDDEDEEGFMTTPIHITSSTLLQTEDEVRVRSASSASQQIGRFEVMMVTEGEANVMSSTPQETSMLLPSHGSSNNSTSQSMLNCDPSDGQQIS